MKFLFSMAFSFCCLITFAQGKSVSSKRSNAIAISISKGKTVYINHCVACHQSDGSGVPNLNPPLSQTPGIKSSKAYLAQVVLQGSRGEVEIDGETFNNVMPPQAHLTDQQIADVLTYIRNDFGNKESAVTPADIKAARKKMK